MNKQDLFGVIVPLVTPVDDQDRVDELELRKLIRFVIEGGVHGVFMGGSSSEAPLLTMDQYVRLMEIGLDEAKGKVQVIGGVMESSTMRAIEKIKLIKQMGYETFVVTPTYYIVSESPSEHLRHFEACLNAADGMQMVAYNIPSCTGSDLGVETVIEMAKRGWVRHCKDSSNIPEDTLALITRGKDVGLRVFMGQHGYIDATMRAGAVGLVPLLANYEPKTLVAAYEAGVSGDFEKLAKAQERINFLVTQFLQGLTCWVSGVKYGVSTLGIGSGRPVLPLEPLNDEQKKRIDALK